MARVFPMLLTLACCPLTSSDLMIPPKHGGLTAKPFRGESSIIEVECTSEALSSDVDVFQMKLFALNDVKYTAYVNPLKNECFTSVSFSSCVIEDKSSRRTRLKTLVLDLEEKESRAYGCNVTSSRPGENVEITAWIITVKSIRMTYKTFQGHEGMYEVECSSNVLDSSTDLQEIVLYSVPENTIKLLASVSLKEKQCYTRTEYVSCTFDNFWPRRSTLRALLVDIQYGESRMFGCNLTSSLSGSVTSTLSWRVVVIRPREFDTM